jgi:hypothetical protein
VRRYRIALQGARWLSVVALVSAAALSAVAATPAHAGQWVQVSCVNPDGSAAPHEGWSGFAQGNPGAFAYNDDRCGPGSPMTALLADSSPAATNSSEWLQYTPPAGSSLAGGTANVTLAANGYGQDAGGNIDALGVARLEEPTSNGSPSDIFYQCVAWLVNCPHPSAGDDLAYSGPVALPANAAGDFFAQAGCAAGTPSGACDENSSHGGWAVMEINSADFLLRSNVSPLGANFSGSALQKGARGTAHLVFTAQDPGGPGVYAVAVALDGRTVFSGTPNDNGGACVAVGTDAADSALMFDHAQPCLQTETVDVPVATSGLADGAHQLDATVTDAAGNVASVRDQTIHTSNPQFTPVARRGVRAQFVISWGWLYRHTTLHSIAVHRLPRSGRVSVRCQGPACPRLKVKSDSVRHVARLLDALRGRRFTITDKLFITVSAPHRRTERIELQIRDNRRPRARLLRP